MQAMSFAVHIPLVAFAIAFPAMVLFVEWLGIRTGDSLYDTLARRWSRVMVALFAVGVITGTVFSFETADVAEQARARAAVSGVAAGSRAGLGVARSGRL